MPQTLSLNRETGRWQVGDRELHAGDLFELELDDGSWLTVRFEWQHHQGRGPTGYCVLALAKGDAALTPPLGASVRLPQECP